MKPVAEEQAVKCRCCAGVYDLKCALIRGVQFDRMSQEMRATWSCLSCRGSTSAKVAKKLANPARQPNENPKTVQDVYNVVVEIKSILDSVVAEQVLINQQVRDMSESQQFLSDQYDELQEQLKAAKNLEPIVQQNQGKIVDLDWKQVTSEQYSRRAHLELGNVPPKQNEDVEKIVLDAALKHGVELEKNDIAAAHRIHASEGKIPPIIVEFVSRRKRNELLEKRKDVPWSADKVYINESLCPYFKKLLFLAKDKCNELDFKYCWFKHNSVFAKLNRDSRTIKIQKFQDLCKIVKPQATSQNTAQIPVQPAVNNTSTQNIGQPVIIHPISTSE